MIPSIEIHLSWIIVLWLSRFLMSCLPPRPSNANTNFCCMSGLKDMYKLKTYDIGVYAQDEPLEFGKTDMRFLSNLLADRPYFYGDEPTLLDMVTFLNLAQLHFIDKNVPHPLRDALNESFPNLVGLVSRIKDHAFEYWDEICITHLITINAKLAMKEVKLPTEDTGPAEKQPLPDEPVNDESDEEEEQEQEPEDKKETDNENEK
ncbi:failed axon connections-like [Achroia grisella]|uniref:failed axon connections-like n=1 Tax=Achroia grisella TaxID=688607 RepID=UPI0027D301DE|nr:failed axon connections-like [Achroia grisella]